VGAAVNIPNVFQHTTHSDSPANRASVCLASWSKSASGILARIARWPLCGAGVGGSKLKPVRFSNPHFLVCFGLPAPCCSLRFLLCVRGGVSRKQEKTPSCSDLSAFVRSALDATGTVRHSSLTRGTASGLDLSSSVPLDVTGPGRQSSVMQGAPSGSDLSSSVHSALDVTGPDRQSTLTQETPSGSDFSRPVHSALDETGPDRQSTLTQETPSDSVFSSPVHSALDVTGADRQSSLTKGEQAPSDSDFSSSGCSNRQSILPEGTSRTSDSSSFGHSALDGPDPQSGLFFLRESAIKVKRPIPTPQSTATCQDVRRFSAIKWYGTE